VALAIWPLARPGRAALAVGACLAGLAVLAGLSIAWSDSAEGAFAESNRIALYLGVFVVVVAAARRGSARSWIDGLGLGIVAVGLLALVSRLFPHLIGQGPIAPEFAGDARVSYPVNYWNGLAILLALAFPAMLRIAAESRRYLVRGAALAPLPALVAVMYLTSSRGGAAVLVVAVVALVALTHRRLATVGAALAAAGGSAIAIVVVHARPELVNGPLNSGAAVSQGRSAAVLLALVCLLTGGAYAAACRLGISGPKIGRRAKRGLAAAGVLVLAAGVVAANPAHQFEKFKQPPVTPKGAYTQAHLLSGAAGNGRWQAWGAALDEFNTRPVLGRGAGSYAAWWDQHASISYVTRYAHSVYLQTLGELGLVGFALLMGAFGLAAVTAAKRLRAARGPDRPVIAAIFAVFIGFAFAAAIDWMWELTVVALVGVVCLGLLVGPATRFGAAKEPPAVDPDHRAARRRNFLGRAGVVAVGLCAIAALAIPLLSQSNIRDSQHAAAGGHTKAALADARSAQRVQPWASTPYLQLALVQEQRADITAARKSIGQAIHRDSLNWQLWLVAARLDERAGAVPAARRSYARAVSLNPKSKLFAGPRDPSAVSTGG
jgi:O-antigen ligase